MNEEYAQFVFPELERTLFTKGARVFALLELLIHGCLIGSCFAYHDLDGLWLSLFFASIFGFVHASNLRARKYCLAKWAFDGAAFHLFIRNERRTVALDQPFCVSKTKLSFSRRYTAEKYPFFMIWKPGGRAPYEEMNGYTALRRRDAILIPCNEETIKLFRDMLKTDDVPAWPRSAVYAGMKNGSLRELPLDMP